MSEKNSEHLDIHQNCDLFLTLEASVGKGLPCSTEYHAVKNYFKKIYSKQ